MRREYIKFLGFTSSALLLGPWRSTRPSDTGHGGGRGSGDADAFAALNAIALVTNGDDALPVLEPDPIRGPQTRRGEGSRVDQRKMRLCASIPRFGMSLTHASHALLRYIVPHGGPTAIFLARPSMGGMCSIG
jgi:hypothetical protein